MMGLLIKDFKLLKIQRRVLFLIVPIALMMGLNVENIYFVLSYLMGFAVFLVIGLLGYDEMDHGYTFLFSLPISHKQYIVEKFIYLLLVECASSVIGIIVVWIAGIYRHTFEVTELFVTLGATFIVMWLIFCILFPVQLAFGPNRMRAVLAVVVGVAFIIGFAFTNVIDTVGIDVSYLIDNFSKIDDKLIIIGLCIVTIIATVISYIVSMNALKGKEF